MPQALKRGVPCSFCLPNDRVMAKTLIRPSPYQKGAPR
ncbi:hypothetical protein SGPA1_12145 [Streptomyces misionensis JCM 4497]